MGLRGLGVSFIMAVLRSAAGFVPPCYPSSGSRALGFRGLRILWFLFIMAVGRRAKRVSCFMFRVLGFTVFEFWGFGFGGFGVPFIMAFWRRAAGQRRMVLLQGRGRRPLPGSLRIAVGVCEVRGLGVRVQNLGCLIRKHPFSFNGNSWISSPEGRIGVGRSLIRALTKFY
ncbi:hypothetical protein T484DRAFT_3556637 [Baffinella frigidus]|nr:hypothetical protein T484DRAFT_3556637 [Cryptophyta sp. CCMP2293]